MKWESFSAGVGVTVVILIGGLFTSQWMDKAEAGEVGTITEGPGDKIVSPSLTGTVVVEEPLRVKSSTSTISSVARWESSADVAFAPMIVANDGQRVDAIAIVPHAMPEMHFYDGAEIGVLAWKDGKMQFRGNADASAKQFFKAFGQYFEETRKATSP